ncbi:MAG: hypothetical protein V1779_08545 [bacterium]
MIKVDESLKEVWEMKERVYEDFKKSGFKNFLDFFESEMKEIGKKYNIKYELERKSEGDNLVKE